MKKQKGVKEILAKYNKSNGCNLINWRDMDYSKIGITNQKKLLSWVRRKGDLKLPVDSTNILIRLKSESHTKKDPTLVEYFLSKGKIPSDIACFLKIPLEELDVVNGKDIEKYTAADTLLTLHNKSNESTEEYCEESC